MKSHIETCWYNRPVVGKTINDIYELPSKLPNIKPSIRYLYGESGFPIKATWIKAIRKGSYLSLPFANIKNANKYFPESKETQKGHIQLQHHGVGSTNVEAPARESADKHNITAIDLPEALPKRTILQRPLRKRDLFIAIHTPRNAICTDQTGKLPNPTNHGYNYQTIIHELDGNSTWSNS